MGVLLALLMIGSFAANDASAKGKKAKKAKVTITVTTKNQAALTKSGKVTVKVANCGSNLCARIVGLAEPISKIDGKPKVDRENPNPSKRNRPLMGLSILIGMKPAGEGQWQGAIYNPDDGKVYSASVRQSGSTLKVKGCVAGVFCKTNTFVKAN